MSASDIANELRALADKVEGLDSPPTPTVEPVTPPDAQSESTQVATDAPTETSTSGGDDVSPPTGSGESTPTLGSGESEPAFTVPSDTSTQVGEDAGSNAPPASIGNPEQTGEFEKRAWPSE
jgi:hypothetical protein